MLKRLALGLAAFAVATIAHAAGTVPGFSLTPQFDLTGAAMPGCKLYVIQAGTVATPQNAYQDTGLTNLLPNPMTCDASARLSQFFVADGLIKLRLTTSSGTQVFVGDNLLVVGPSSGGGGGGVIDPTTIASTGDVKTSYSANPISGWVRMNGRTIGSATSGATERANADTQALFQYLWGADTNLAVSGGRGASAAADWSANKTIALPDARGRVVAGMDTMGNTAAGRLTTSGSGVDGTTIGAAAGSQSQPIAQGNLPAIALAFSGTQQTWTVSTDGTLLKNSGFEGSVSSSAEFIGFNSAAPTVTITPAGTVTAGGSSTLGSGNSLVTTPPTIVLTYYVKL